MGKKALDQPLEFSTNKVVSAQCTETVKRPSKKCTFGLWHLPI